MNKKDPPLESGLLAALQALDKQIAREMQRTPSEREEHGVQKWRPMMARVERVSALLIESFGKQEVEMESILVLAQSMVKSVKILMQELGEEGLGAVRSSYCREIMKAVAEDAREALGETAESDTLM